MNSAVAIISLLGVLTQPVQDNLIGGNFFTQGDHVYVMGWWSYPDLSRVPDSETVQNVTAGTFTTEEGLEILEGGKALVIHGLPSMQAALDLFGLVRCNPDGSDIETEH